MAIQPNCSSLHHNLPDRASARHAYRLARNCSTSEFGCFGSGVWSSDDRIVVARLTPLCFYEIYMRNTSDESSAAALLWAGELPQASREKRDEDHDRSEIA